MASLSATAMTYEVSVSPYRDGVGYSTALVSYACIGAKFEGTPDEGPDYSLLMYQGAPGAQITIHWTTYRQSQITYIWLIQGQTFSSSSDAGTYRVTNLHPGAKNTISVALTLRGQETPTYHTETYVWTTFSEDPADGTWSLAGSSDTDRSPVTITGGPEIVSPESGLDVWTRPGLFTDYDMVKDAQGRFPIIEQFLDLTKIENWVSHCRDYYEWYHQKDADENYENVLSQALPSSIYVTKAWFNNCVSCCANVDTRPYPVTSQNNDDVIRAALFARQITDNTTTPPTISYPSRSLGGAVSDATEV